MSNSKTLVLVDGSSYLYRAFHAMPDLRAVPGDPTSAATGAIRGMINMMQALRKEVAADYAVCVFDASGPTFRDEIYTEYKAQRAPMPDDLRSQIDPIHDVVRMLGWKVVAVPKVEADDVIATLARIAAEQGIDVVVSSGDKDLSQLVNERITIIDTMNGKKRDVAGVTEEFGVLPSLMVDFQALVGDTVDNVPGVTKVGPKTASKWLLEYGSLDKLVENAADIKGVAAISNEMKDLADRAKAGKLQPSEYQGGTASLSNMGMFGIKQFEAVINPPQGMIMAIGAGEKRPFVVDDSLQIATVMSATGSFDHRAIDGADGARLMKAFRELIENPLGMLA